MDTHIKEKSRYSLRRKRSIEVSAVLVASPEYLSLHEFLHLQHLFLKRRTCRNSDSSVFFFSREPVDRSLKSSRLI